MRLCCWNDFSWAQTTKQTARDVGKNKLPKLCIANNYQDGN